MELPKQTLVEGFFPTKGTTQSKDKIEKILSHAAAQDPTSKEKYVSVEPQSPPRQEKAWVENIHSMPLDWGQVATNVSVQSEHSMDAGPTSLPVSESAGVGATSPPGPYQPSPHQGFHNMDTSPYKGSSTPFDTTSIKTPHPSKFPPPATVPVTRMTDPPPTVSVILSTAETAASTISSIMSATLWQSKYAGVSHGEIAPNEMPTGNEGKDIFEKVESEGNSPGKWMLSWSMEKVVGTQVADQLHAALGTTVRLCAASVNEFKLHPHDQNPNLAAITSEKPEGNFPKTGGACQQYVYFPMEWQLAAAKEKKARPAKISEHRYDGEVGEYSGPERVSGVILVSTDGDIKKMVQRTRLDLEGTGIAVWWKDVQMKDTVKAIQIPCAINGFCLEGITQSCWKYF